MDIEALLRQYNPWLEDEYQLDTIIPQDIYHTINSPNKPLQPDDPAITTESSAQQSHLT